MLTWPGNTRNRGSSQNPAWPLLEFDMEGKPITLRLFINLTPFIPLSLKRRGGRDSREGRRPSLTHTPPSLTKGKGVRGIGC